MKPEQQRLIDQYEYEARYDLSCLKAGELSQQEAADLITNHCLEFENAASELGFFRAWLTRRKLRKLRDRLIAQLPVMAM